MLRDLLPGLITTPWEKIANQVSDIFDLEMLPLPVDMRPSKEARTGKFGGWLTDQKLILSPACTEGKFPHIGVLAREYLYEALTQEGFEETVNDDFSWAFGALWLSSKYRKIWYKKWKEYCRFKGDEGTGLFRPSEAFNLFQTFSGHEYFNKLLNEYILMKRNGLELDEQDYVLHMLERLRRFSVQLTPTDFNIIRRLLESPGISRSALAKDSGKTLSWVSRRMATLQDHGVLKRVHEVFYPKLGMNEKILLMNSLDESLILEFIIDSPFLHSANRISAGEYDVFAHLFIPNDGKNLRALDTYMKILADFDIDAKLLDITAIHTNRCFDHYSATRNRWEMPWELFIPHLRRIHDEQLASIIAPEMQQCVTSDVHLSTLDLEIINEYRIGNPLREMRKNLGIKYDRMTGHLKKLEEAGIIQQNFELHHCGLNEFLLAQISSPSHFEAISSWSQRLPYSQIMKGDDESLLFLHLPDGGLQGMALVLQSLSPTLKPMLLDPQTQVGKWYASDNSWFEAVQNLWDEDSQRWRNSSDEISDWFAAIL